MRWLPVGVWGSSVAVAAVLCFVPLFDLLGLESALVMGVVLGLAAMLLTDDAFASGRVSLPLDPLRSRPPGRDFFRLLAGHLGLLVPTAGLLALNALRVRNCDPLLGVAFWALIPAVSIAVGQSLVWGAAALAPRRAARLGLALLVVLADAAWFGWRLAWEPSIMGHTLLLGWFPGSLYDEAIHVTPALLWYRLLCGGLVAVVVLGVDLAWRRRVGREQAPWVWALAISSLVLGGAWLARKHHGVGLVQADVVEELGATAETEHFRIHYSPKSVDAARLPQLIEDHEFRYAELEAFTGVDVVAWKGRRIDSFVYPDHATQYRLMGSRRTLVARPWTHQMHIRWTRLGDTALAHELAHLFSAPFGVGPSRLATRGGPWAVDLGMVEGFAYAADWPPGSLTAHEAAAAMRRLDIAPDLRVLFRPSGFWGQPSGKAYTLMGSFVRWLIDERGVEAFLDVYGDGDWQGVYGEDPDALVSGWEAWVDQLDVSEEELELARFKYSRGSIFEKTCARTIAELDRRADIAEARRDWPAARALRDEILGHQPGKPDHALALADLYDAMGDAPSALAVLDELLAREKLKAGMRAKAQERRGDIRWRAGEDASALEDFTACLGTGIAESTRRRLLVKTGVLAAQDPLVEPLARRYMVGRTRSASALYLALKWASASPDDPLPRYLVGLQLARNDEHPDAVDALSGPPGLLSDALLDEQRRVLLATSLVRLGRFDEAEAVLRGLLDSPRSSRVVWATEYLDRVAFLRTWPGFEAWSPP